MFHYSFFIIFFIIPSSFVLLPSSSFQEMLNSSPAIRMAVPTGTMVVMDSRTHHRGSENLSNKRRTALYVEITSFNGLLGFI
jgi:hypothetical protein